jgi:hypothetical protein
MAWYFEIRDKDRGVLETSEPIYAFEFDAQIAGYQRIKADSNLLSKADPDLHSAPASAKNAVLVSRLTPWPKIVAKQQ